MVDLNFTENAHFMLLDQTNLKKSSNQGMNQIDRAYRYLEAPEPKYFFRYDIILSTGSLLKSKNDELSPMEYRHHSISSSVRPLSRD